MKAQEFCYWLQGYFEINDGSPYVLNNEQINIIKNHLALVFHHDIDPKQGSSEHQLELDDLHDGNGFARC